jgi:hypothetical protein
MTSKKRRTIDAIVGEQLSGVAFIMDYVEFQFDGMMLRALAHPLLRIGDMLHRFPEPGSRDAFCSVIGEKVEGVEVVEEERITVYLRGGALIEIPLAITEPSLPEAAHFTAGVDQPLDVW